LKVLGRRRDLMSDGDTLVRGEEDRESSETGRESVDWV